MYIKTTNKFFYFLENTKETKITKFFFVKC